MMIGALKAAAVKAAICMPSSSRRPRSNAYIDFSKPVGLLPYRHRRCKVAANARGYGLRDASRICYREPPPKRLVISDDMRKKVWLDAAAAAKEAGCGAAKPHCLLPRDMISPKRLGGSMMQVAHDAMMLRDAILFARPRRKGVSIFAPHDNEASLFLLFSYAAFVQKFIFAMAVPFYQFLSKNAARLLIYFRHLRYISAKLHAMPHCRAWRSLAENNSGYDEY